MPCLDGADMSVMPGISKIRLLLLVSLVISLLSACNHQPEHLAPIEQLGQPPDIRLRHHVVSRGDTLYSIAWRYGMDYRQLATLNSIRSPYIIYVGQKIRLSEQAENTGSEELTSQGTQVVAVPDDSQGVTEVGGVQEVKPAQPVNTKKMASQPATEEVAGGTAMEKPAPAVAQPASAGQWRWPASGRVLSSFSSADPLRKGIDIDGKSGDPVLAARGGNVVYAGSGLAGYGQLVIVKHDEQFLSAYGHNSKLLVKEGDAVKAGQTIAEIGSSGTDSNKLHFEIRRGGKPVDPLQYLPAK